MERAATVIPEYGATSGRFAQFLERMSGRQPGDPDRAAAAIVDMVHQGKAPLRMALGRYAVEKIRKWVQTRDAEALEWSATAASADFPP